MAGFDDITDGFHKLFLASVGAVATTAEKSKEVVEDLVKKGELTVEQGKTLNKELTRKAKEVMEGTSDAAMRDYLASMTPEERAAYAAKVSQMAADIDAEDVEVEAEEAKEETTEEETAE